MNKKWIVLIIVGIVAAAALVMILYSQWLSGLGIYSHGQGGYEKLEYKSYRADLAPSGDFIVYLTLRNTGAKNLTTDELFVNGTSWNERADTIYQNISGVSSSLGQYQNGVLILSRGNTWSSGTTVEIAIVTMSGKEYTKAITLP